MNYETMKSFILFVLVGVSFLLSFLLWSYQPNYDYLNDTDYVNEVDVGGAEKTKNELIQPAKIVFNTPTETKGFKDPDQMQHFYNDMASWVLYDYEMSEAAEEPDDGYYVEITFPNIIPAELLPSLFTFNDDVKGANWSFDRIYLVLHEDEQSIDVIIRSTDDRRQIKAAIDKSDIYQEISGYMVQENNDIEEYITLQTERSSVHIPKNSQDIPRKTVIASEIKPDRFISALFRKPSLVTRNVREAYFTDGQRGMQVSSDNLSLEYINPIQSNYERLSAMELIDKSVSQLNDHKGWTNDFHFDSINRVTNNVRYRMVYDNYPIFNNQKLSIIEQEWRDQELYSYTRPLVEVGNVLNVTDVDLISGEELINMIKSNDSDYKVDNIKDIRIGYDLNLLDDDRSLTLEPNWFILYENQWTRFDADSYLEDSEEG